MKPPNSTGQLKGSRSRNDQPYIQKVTTSHETNRPSSAVGQPMRTRWLAFSARLNPPSPSASARPRISPNSEKMNSNPLICPRPRRAGVPSSPRIRSGVGRSALSQPSPRSSPSGAGDGSGPAKRRRGSKVQESSALCAALSRSGFGAGKNRTRPPGHRTAPVFVQDLKEPDEG